MFVFRVILVRIFRHSDRMQENTDQNNSKYGHFSHSVTIERKDLKNKLSIRHYLYESKLNTWNFFSKWCHFAWCNGIDFFSDFLFLLHVLSLSTSLVSSQIKDWERLYKSNQSPFRNRNQNPEMLIQVKFYSFKPNWSF